MRHISVLLVDDSLIFLKVTTRFLERDERLSVVGVAHGGREGLARALELQPHVILLDLAMPDLPGLAVIPRLRVELPETGIIALTFWDAVPYREAALQAGADAFVLKSAMDRDLLPAIYQLVSAEGQGNQAEHGSSQPAP